MFNSEAAAWLARPCCAGWIRIACVLLTSLTFGAGCASATKTKSAGRYYEAGSGAERRGDLAQARIYYYHSFANAHTERLGPAAEAAALYEWARVSGYLGQRADAEWAFPKTLELIKDAKQKADDLRAPVLSEFARYLHDTGQHERALSIFKQAIEESRRRGVENEDPIGFADFLNDYAASLKAVGRTTEADAFFQRSHSLREAHPQASPKYKSRRYA